MKTNRIIYIFDHDVHVHRSKQKQKYQKKRLQIQEFFQGFIQEHAFRIRARLLQLSLKG